ncbi:MAG TPA: beta-N-acetylhexosaminidase [Tepidisphaeraceae bacterium]
MTARLVSAAGTPQIIPAPQSLTKGDGGPFIIEPGKTKIVCDPALTDLAKYLKDVISPALGTPLTVEQGKAVQDGAITLKINPSLVPNDESYELSSSVSGVTITGRSNAGVFYGIQTFRQLLPPAIFGKNKVDGTIWSVPPVTIHDQPRFAWRGMMMDVSRHFFSKDEVKQFIDLLALHKFNTFHWHLVDDQGWRIEIKKYPKLTELGAWRKAIGFGLDPKDGTAYGPDGRYGGFYTQEDIREVVAYAQSRYITIVPEIEMPGHSSAALVAYPQLACVGNTKFTTDLPGGIFPGIYCASNPEADQFVQDVLSEVIELFPGKYIHIGGDEVMKEPWHNCTRCQAYMKQHNIKDEHALQSDFTKRVDKFITSKGRRMVGWDEILEGGLAEGATVMSWRGTAGGIAAAKAGHDVVMSPTSHCYFDQYQADPSTQPKAIGGYDPLIKVYAFEPVPAELSADEAKHVLGAQANLWAEYFPNFRQVQYMAYPRACALAEVVWSPKDKRDWNDFASRLRDAHLARLDAMGVNYCKAAIDAPLKRASTQPEQ